MLERGRVRQVYNISAGYERENAEVVVALVDELARQTGEEAYSDSKVQFVEDRKGHDFRYGTDSSKLRRELGWEPQTSFEEGIRKTVYWYLTHRDWVKRTLEDGVAENNQRLLEEWDEEAKAAKKQERKDAEKAAKAAKRASRHRRGRHLLKK